MVLVVMVIVVRCIGGGDGHVELVKKTPMAQTTVNRRLGPLHAHYGPYGTSGVCWRKKRLNLIKEKHVR
jgi:hypothetical protein